MSFEKWRELRRKRRIRASDPRAGKSEHHETARFEATAQHGFTAQSARRMAFDVDFVQSRDPRATRPRRARRAAPEARGLE